MYTNINLSGNNNTYTYAIEYIDNIYTSAEQLNYSVIDNCICINPGSVYRKDNMWHNVYYSNNENNLPTQYSKSKINVYIPQFNVETYKKGIYYALDINTWICGKKVCLGTYIFNSMDLVASPTVKYLYDNRYYEVFSVDIVSPWEIIYSDSWKNFRQNVCGESNSKEHPVNSVGSILNFSLHPVEHINDKYILCSDYHGGQNSLNVSYSTSDFFNAYLESNVNKLIVDEPAFNCIVKFNDVYNGSLPEYVLETYNLSLFNIKCNLVIGNANKLVKIIELKSKSKYQTSWEFKKSDIGNIVWEPGLFITSSIDLINENGDSILYLPSNKIPFTKELFSYFNGESFIVDDDKKINNVNLDYLDMNYYNINCVNKIEQQTIQLTHYEKSKNNILTPVFYSNQQAGDIIIHPEVTETICINLDKYKSKVDNFTLQLEETYFNELGKTPAGILFKIVGKLLPGEKTSGNYYILDQNMEMVTTGKYSYV